jgi:ABC-type transport system involved in multi-copper enzyme maturation permease subunit
VKSFSFSPRRTLIIAGSAVLEATRQRLFACLLIFAIGFVLGARWLREFNFGAPELKFVTDCGFAAMSFFGSALTIAAMAQLFFAEIENRSVLTLLAKPVCRSEYVVGKFLAAVTVAAAFCALLTVLMAAVLFWRECELVRLIPESFPSGASTNYLNLAIGGFLQWLRLSVLAAFALLIASFAQTQLFTVIGGFLVLVVCNLQSLAHDVYARSELWFSRWVGLSLTSVFPDFQVFSLANAVPDIGGGPHWHLIRVIAYGIIYMTVASSLAVFCFGRREL